MEQDPILRAYFRDIGSSGGFTAEAEAELTKRIEAGDDEALGRLVEGNLQFVVFVAKEYRNHGLPLSELISAGNVGLMEGAKRFDSKRGVRFITYAAWWIRQSIGQALRQETRTVRLPDNRIGELNAFRKAAVKMEQELGQSPTVTDMAQELDTAEEELEFLLCASREPISLDARLSVAGTGSSIGDTIADDSLDDILTRLEAEDTRREVTRMVNSLSPAEADVLKSYYGLDGRNADSLEGVGTATGRSRERIRQIRGRALNKLRSRSRSTTLRELQEA